MVIKIAELSRTVIETHLEAAYSKPYKDIIRLNVRNKKGKC